MSRKRSGTSKEGSEEKYSLTIVLLLATLDIQMLMLGTEAGVRSIALYITGTSPLGDIVPL